MTPFSEPRQVTKVLGNYTYRLSDGQRCPADVFGAVARAQEPTPASAAEDTTRLAAARGPSPRGSGPGGDL